MRRLLLFVILACYIFPADAQVTMVIKSLPPNTPLKDTMFLASSLNNWNPHDKLFAFKSIGKDNQTLVIKSPLDSFGFKLCRGNWNKVEVDSIGKERNNRYYTKALGDKIEIKVFGWRDLAPKRKSTVTKGVSYVPTSIEMTQLGRKRTIRMYFPPDYSSGKRFPVIYMHDGQNLFDDATAFCGEWKVDEILDSLYKYNRFSCIVVGITMVKVKE
jgi:hypothetical protein